MGIYSEVINSCDDLGQEYIGYLQTKDLDGCFDQYWISPDGCLFRVYWPFFRQDEELGPETQQVERPHGRVAPCRFTGLVRFSGGTGRRPVWFIDGQLISARGRAWWPVP